MNLQKGRKITERFADDINHIAGSFTFFICNLLFFSTWVIFMGKIDPFPYSLLTMIVSLEAIILSIFVLMAQNRQNTIDTIREELHLQINQIAEKEITKSLQLLADIHTKIITDKKPDPELTDMLKRLDSGKIESQIEKELESSPLLISELISDFEKKLHIKK